MDLTKTYTLCIGVRKTITLDLGTYASDWYAVAATSDASLTTLYRPDGSVLGYAFENVTPGTYTASVTVRQSTADGDILGTYTIAVIVKSVCTELTTNCCEGVDIAWINREGGIQNFYFNGKAREFNVRQDDVANYIDSRGIARYARKGQVYRGMVISAGDITKEQVDLLDGLRISIQQYVEAATTLYPIVVDADNFTKYKRNDKFYDVTITFYYATPINIQTN